jgi:hypothetical protein
VASVVVAGAAVDEAVRVATADREAEETVDEAAREAEEEDVESTAFTAFPTVAAALPVAW